MAKKGFTLVEILATIVIITVILLIAVPIYNGVSNNIKESVYESKIKEVLAKSTSYASEQNKFVFDIKTLIQNGSITADNELGEFIDPRNNRDMQCDIINVVYKDNQYNASITESDECYTEEELGNLYGIVELKLEDENKNEIPKIEGTEWLNKNKVYVSYKIKENYQEYQDSITSITWLGEAEKSCNKDNLGECERYLVTSEEIKNVVVSLQIKFNINNAEIINTVNKTILLDLQKPTVVDGSIVVNNDININNARKVDFEITDQSGSGVKYYSIVKEKTCNGTEYNSNKQLAENGIQSVYLENGSYYICVEDKVGNKTSDSDLDNSKNQITVSGVDQSIPVINSFAVKSRVSGYNSLDTTLTISASDDNGTSGLKMCISNTGYLSGCSWENYSSTKNWRLSGTLDGGTRTVYLSIQDSAGNIVNREAKYTVYKDCSNQSKVYTESNYGTCSKTCGGGIQYRAYQMKDTKTNTICSTGKDSKTCNTQSCGPELLDFGSLNFSNNEYLESIVPVSNGKVIGFYSGNEQSFSSGRCYNEGYLSGWVFEFKNNNLTMGPRNNIYGSPTNYLENSGAYGEMFGMRINDSIVAIMGHSRYMVASKIYYNRPTVFTVRISGTTASYVSSYNVLGNCGSCNNTYRIVNFACAGSTCYIERTNTTSKTAVYSFDIYSNGSISTRKVVYSSGSYAKWVYGDIENRVGQVMYGKDKDFIDYTSSSLLMAQVSSSEYVYSKFGYDIMSSTGEKISDEDCEMIVRLGNNKFVAVNGRKATVYEKTNNKWNKLKTYQFDEKIKYCTNLAEGAVVIYYYDYDMDTEEYYHQFYVIKY